LSILYVVGLELIFALQRWVILVALTVVVVVAIGVVLVRIEEKGKFSLSQVVLPLLATVGLSGFAFLLPTSAILHVYILAAGGALFFLLKHGAKQAYPIWNWLISLLIYFLNIAFIAGLRFHLYIPVLLVLIAIFIVTGLMSWQALRRIALGVEIIIPVLVMAFVLTEIAWALQFLPAHYLVLAGVVTALYYSMFNILSLSINKQPTRREVYEYAGIGIAALMILIISAKWV